MEPAFQALTEACQRGYGTFVDCYGATNRAEFFAVVTETFFERPLLLRRHWADVYEAFRDYYRLDPATWGNRTGPDDDFESP